MNNSIISIGTANPGAAIQQKSIGEFMKMAHSLGPLDARKLQFVYSQSGIDNRYSVLKDFEKNDFKDFRFFPQSENLEPFPSTRDRMRVFQQEAPSLAIKAISNCLSNSEVKAEEVTHLILVSCTGMYAPGLELEIMGKMGFKDTVERYCIHFMGCYAAFTAIKMADRICTSDPEAKVVLACVELCTIHFQKDYNEDNLLANALFGDGAAAALVANSKQGIGIKDYQSNLVREGEGDMAWHIGDFGFEMKLSKYIPGLLEKGIEALGKKLEEKFKLSTIKNFAIHPGGKMILKKVEESFGIDSEQNCFAHQVLRDFGNMSSATILFVLEKILKQDGNPGEILAMGFGPGLTLETLLLDKQ
ncbi:type III polyketide synthase [Litoribacter ruber]|uniref:Type III polyketide synthase n=1 Tax=Litoribacter ruber TaxID=702568 RepID=A0AAP2CG47_9BACT|nr:MULTISPECIES: type III polyketide synthase [Litoribacter]MBS9523427.1 type III polyketide synthase [Litoribacter alkaliphilus]MBT0812447.1 type III polyketide synthase [Litoribacter ruber]